MTPTPLTPEQRQKARIALAEACGWRHQAGEEPCYGGSFKAAGWFTPGGGFVRGGYGEKWKHIGTPNYPESLDACAQVEAMLTEEQINQYERELAYQMRGSASKPGPGYKLWHATATQRTLALLTVLKPEWND